jgi:hypothetical protein
MEHRRESVSEMIGKSGPRFAREVIDGRHGHSRVGPINIHLHVRRTMNNIFRTLIAGWGAKKAGLGCFGTILVFVLLYWLLGKL